ncbi:Unknown protein, partial [Striga hermonthica]
LQGQSLAVHTGLGSLAFGDGGGSSRASQRSATAVGLTSLSTGVRARPPLRVATPSQVQHSVQITYQQFQFLGFTILRYSTGRKESVNRSFYSIPLTDGSSDPSRHVRTFENMAVLYRYSDSVCCRALLSTLRGGALDWFHQLPPGLIADFEDFVSKLTNQYSSAVAKEKTYFTLMAMRQGEKESLRKYVARYNQTCLEVHSASDELKAGVLIRSLQAGPCRTSLAKTPARSYEDKPRRDGNREGHGREAPMKRGTIYMISRGPMDGDSNRARKEHARPVKRKREEVGITASMPVISFKAEDAEGVVLPHNDAFVITAEVAGFDVKRVFIDTGSSVDMMFYDCFVQINKELNMELKPVTTALYGFNGGEVVLMGEVSLPVALGAEELRKVRMVRFVVVGAQSSYNIITWRTSLNAFQAVVSTYHMTIKYPVGEN